MKKVSRVKLIEDFKIFVNSLYEHQSVMENAKIVDEFDKKTKAMGGEFKAVVRVTLFLPKEKLETKTYDIVDVVNNGIDLPENALAFEARVDVASAVKNGDVITGGVETPFRSMLFILTENATILKNIEIPQGIRIVNSMELYAEKSGNRIRFGEENKLEL